jgi:hypothetical protein
MANLIVKQDKIEKKNCLKTTLPKHLKGCEILYIHNVGDKLVLS